MNILCSFPFINLCSTEYIATVFMYKLTDTLSLLRLTGTTIRSSALYTYPINGLASRRTNTMEKPVENAIVTKLTAALNPIHMQVLNESPGHNVRSGAESHFRVLIVSEAFKDQPLLQRHRLVHDALKEELKGLIHALSIQAKSPEQWNESTVMDKSPPCQGGHGK